MIRGRPGGKARAMPDATPAPVPDMEELADEVVGFLESAPVAEALGLMSRFREFPPAA